MNVVAELKKERDKLESQLAKLDQAIVLLGFRTLNGNGAARPKRTGHRWSAAARARAAARMRAAWKSGKMRK